MAPRVPELEPSLPQEVLFLASLNEDYKQETEEWELPDIWETRFLRLTVSKGVRISNFGKAPEEETSGKTSYIHTAGRCRLFKSHSTQHTLTRLLRMKHYLLYAQTRHSLLFHGEHPPLSKLNNKQKKSVSPSYAI